MNGSGRGRTGKSIGDLREFVKVLGVWQPERFHTVAVPRLGKVAVESCV